MAQDRNDTQSQSMSADVRRLGGPFGRSLGWSAWIVVLFAAMAASRVIAAYWLVGAAGIALVAWIGQQLVRRRWRWRSVALSCVGFLAVAAVGFGVRTYFRYQTADEMLIDVREYDNAEYPEDPALRSVCYGKYRGRQLRLVKKDTTHFDFIFEPRHPHVARVVFRNVDVSLFVTALPDWTKEDSGLRRIALTDREWNRQQVSFERDSAHLEITDGDGLEQEHLYSAELAKNCLNAGLWEVLLFEKQGPEKALYYQGWFTFPLGHYRDVFERNTGLSYRNHWYYLEHWFDPAGTPVPMDKLREVLSEREVTAKFDATERLIIAGEQVRKRRTVMAENVTTWGDFFDGRPVHFASFVAPGHYSVQHPWGNRYDTIDRFEKAILREIRSPATQVPLHELELVFSNQKNGGTSRFFVSGFDLARLPQLPTNDYPHGMYMPMGIGVPPFFQSYEELETHAPQLSPYVSVLVDDADRWIDHHSLAIDGPVLHRDEHDASVLHLYLLSYERHTLVAHFRIDTRLVVGE